MVKGECDRQDTPHIGLHPESDLCWNWREQPAPGEPSRCNCEEGGEHWCVQAERERCAKIAESTPDLVVGITKSVQGRIADAIRRGEGVC